MLTKERLKNRDKDNNLIPEKRLIEELGEEILFKPISIEEFANFIDIKSSIDTHIILNYLIEPKFSDEKDVNGMSYKKRKLIVDVIMEESGIRIPKEEELKKN